MRSKKFDYLIINWRRLRVETHHFKHPSGEPYFAKLDPGYKASKNVSREQGCWDKRDCSGELIASTLLNPGIETLNARYPEVMASALFLFWVGRTTEVCQTLHSNLPARIPLAPSSVSLQNDNPSPDLWAAFGSYWLC
jgi:hypothetical protein